MTIDLLKANEDQLRQLAGGMLKPGPYCHTTEWLSGNKAICTKCGKKAETRMCLQDEGPVCPVPDPDSRLWEVIARQLLEKIRPTVLLDAIAKVHPHESLSALDSDMIERMDFEWFIWRPAIEQVRVCLLALRGRK